MKMAASTKSRGEVPLPITRRNSGNALEPQPRSSRRRARETPHPWSTRPARRKQQRSSSGGMSMNLVRRTEAGGGAIPSVYGCGAAGSDADVGISI